MAGIDQYTKLMLHMNDNSFKDEIGHVATNTNVILDTTNKVFGNGSNYFNGSSWLEFADYEDWNFGSGDFTIDFRVKLGRVGVRQEFICQVDSSQSISTLSFEIGIFADNTIYFGICNGTTYYGITSTNKITDITNFHHIECCRYGNFIYLFVDGNLWGSKDVTGITLVNSNSKMVLGKTGEANVNYFKGNIDEFRISKGIARHTSNFIPPIIEYSFANFLIKQNSNYYTIKSTSYDSTTTHNFIPLNLTGGSTPNKVDVDTYGFTDLSILTNSMVVNTDTFIPVLKFDNTAELKLYKG